MGWQVCQGAQATTPWDRTHKSRQLVPTSTGRESRNELCKITRLGHHNASSVLAHWYMSLYLGLGLERLPQWVNGIGWRCKTLVRIQTVTPGASTTDALSYFREFAIELFMEEQDQSLVLINTVSSNCYWWKPMGFCTSIGSSSSDVFSRLPCCERSISANQCQHTLLETSCYQEASMRDS